LALLLLLLLPWLLLLELSPRPERNSENVRGGGARWIEGDAASAAETPAVPSWGEMGN
jgi:hypothetical protein